MHKNKHTPNTRLNSEPKYKDAFPLKQLRFFKKAEMFLFYFFNNR